MAEQPAATGPGDGASGVTDLASSQERSRLARARSAARDRAALYADIANRRWPAVVMLADLWRRYRRLNGTALAGNLAFRIFVWLLPVTLMIVALLAVANDGGVEVEQQVGNRLGDAFRQAVSTSIADGRTSKWQAAGVALVGLVLASSGLLSAFHYAALQLWELPPGPPPRRAARAAKLAGALTFTVVVLAVLGAVRSSGIVVGLMAVAVNAVFTAGLLVALFWMMPRRATSWPWLVPGALAGAAAVVVLQAYTAFWLPRHVASLSTTYGTFGIAAAALGYLFLNGLIIVVAMLVNVVWWDYHQARRQTSGA